MFDDAALRAAAEALDELRAVCPFELPAITGVRLMAACVSTLAAYRELREDAGLASDFAAACVQHLAERLPLAPPSGARAAMLATCERMIKSYAAELAR